MQTNRKARTLSDQPGNSMTIGKPLQKGRWRSGNPGGRPKVVAEIKELARAHTDKAIETLVSIMDNPKAAPVARVSAANALLDRGYGKPPQHISGEGGPSYVVRLPEPCKIFPWSHLTIGTDMKLARDVPVRYGRLGSRNGCQTFRTNLGSQSCLNL